MKALSVVEVPPGEWHVEIKWDGFRALAVINRGRVELWSRNHKPLGDSYPEVVAALEGLRCTNAVIDGEIVALDARGQARFQLLQGRGAGVSRPAIVYYVFDLLYLDGRPLMAAPIEQRQEKLQKCVGRKSKIIRISPVFEVEPAELLDEARKQGFEGIITKAKGSRYEPDRRSGAWLKCKIFGEQEFVIGGFTPPKNSRTHFGAILVGYFRDGRLQYAGKVGSGFDRKGLESLYRQFVRGRTAESPFADLPASARRGVTWVKPKLVAQVRFAEWTNDGLLRQPVFLGLRTDKAPKEVVREAGPVTP